MIELIVLGLIGGMGAAAVKKKSAVATASPTAAEEVAPEVPTAEVPSAAQAAASAPIYTTQQGGASQSIAPAPAPVAPVADASAPAPAATTPKAAGNALKDALLGRQRTGKCPPGYEWAIVSGGRSNPVYGCRKKGQGPGLITGGLKIPAGGINPNSPVQPDMSPAPPPASEQTVTIMPINNGSSGGATTITQGTSVLKNAPSIFAPAPVPKLTAPVTPAAPVKNLPAAVRAVAAKTGMSLPTSAKPTAVASSVAKTLLKAPLAPTLATAKVATAAAKPVVSAAKSVGKAIKKLF